MKTIELSQGKFAMVDDEDFERLSKHKWSLRGGGGYAHRGGSCNGKKFNVYMHRVILNAQPGETVDHINGDGLDNRRANLRLCTQKQNARNVRIHGNNKSGYKGVYETKHAWIAGVMVDGKKVHIGSFRDKHTAAMHYNIAAIAYFGEFAHLNKIEVSTDAYEAKTATA